MTDDTKPPGGWPGPERPGVPMNPERDGWHWVQTEPRQPTTPMFWHPINEWQQLGGPGFLAETMARRVREWGWRYLAPVLLPAEVAAREAAAWCAGRDAAAADADCGCDERAAVLAAKTKGERHRACSREPCSAWEAASIRDLAPPADLSSALAARVAAARAEGMREAAELAQAHYRAARESIKEGKGDAAIGGAYAATEIAAAILAAIEKKEPTT